MKLVLFVTNLVEITENYVREKWVLIKKDIKEEEEEEEEEWRKVLNISNAM